MNTDADVKPASGVCSLSEAKSLKPTPVTNGKDAMVKLRIARCCEHANSKPAVTNGKVAMVKLHGAVSTQRVNLT